MWIWHESPACGHAGRAPVFGHITWLELTRTRGASGCDPDGCSRTRKAAAPCGARVSGRNGIGVRVCTGLRRRSLPAVGEVSRWGSGLIGHGATRASRVRRALFDGLFVDAEEAEGGVGQAEVDVALGEGDGDSVLAEEFDDRVVELMTDGQ